MYPIFSYEFWNIPEEKKEEIREVLSYLYFEMPNMSGIEAETIEKYCTPDSEVLEFGSGFSTLHLTKKCKHLISVEHSNEWYARVVGLAMMFRVQNLDLVHSWQYTLGENDSKSLKSSETRNYSYHNVIQLMETHRHKKFDVVSIDGLCRANCAKSILPNLHDDSVVIFSDFWVEQRQKERDYLKVFEWYDEVESCKEGNTFVVLKRKKSPVWV
tara:strand:+ start:3750 stop:4391 length:642 start_codon:yes stop_codon:yes gene_type:complete